VIGVEGDISGTGIRNTTITPITFGGVPGPGGGFNQMAERDIRWLATIRGRLGYAADRWLIYVTGGGAWGEVDYTAGPNIGAIYSPVMFSHTSSGWTVGGGFEYAFTNNWTARLEYLYYDLDGASVTNPVISCPALATTETWDRNKINVVRVGVNYKF
jgi:outer membrane immunogenic protein